MPSIAALKSSVMKITVIESYTSRIVLDVTLDVSSEDIGAISGGHLYCIAMNNGSAPSSTEAIVYTQPDSTSSRMASAIIPSISKYPSSLQVTITQLSAIKLYAIYCYVSSATGKGDSLEAVLRTKISATTACCKTISLTNSPTYVYSNVSRHSSSSSSLFVFKYQLSSAPVGSLIVTPQFFIGGVRSTGIVATPAFIAFDSASLLTGEFFLSSAPTFEGVRNMILTVSGAAAAQYQNGNATVQFLSATSPIPAPKIISCQFADGGQAVIMSFDSPSDRAGITAINWPCSILFTFKNSNSTTCKWIDAMTVRATFSALNFTGRSNDTLSVGQIVALNGGLLKAFCPLNALNCSINPTAVKKSLALLAPLYALSPTVILSTPSALGSCTNLSLDATSSYGGGGRPYTSIIWDASARTTNGSIIDVSSLKKYMNAFSAVYQVIRPINVARNSLIEGTYNFTLRLTNFLGAESSTYADVTVTNDPELPLLTVIGSLRRTMIASAPLTIFATAAPSSCAKSISAIKFTWTVQSKGRTLPLSSFSRDPTRFSLRSYALTADTAYTITVTASTDTSSAVASVSVYVSHGPLTAAVKGGYKRSVPLDKSLTLDGSISVDADNRNATSLGYKVMMMLCA